ncbi:hypothetical protein BH10ACT1_BH10ACT1_18150 [soil metagenome]
MVQLALLLLAPILGFTVADRRTTFAVLGAAWAVLMVPQTHAVLLVDQLHDRSYGNTIGYFAINYLTLVLAVGLAGWLNARRQRARKTSAVAV